MQDTELMSGLKVNKKKRAPIAQGVRFDVFRRDNFTCVYCGAQSPEATLHADHVKAVANGGSNDISNLVTACDDCNYGKGIKIVNHKRRHSANDNGLVGLFGHSRYDDGTICWQFEITSVVGDACTIQLFSWVDGMATDVKVVSVADLSTDKYSLYGSREVWIDTWKREKECA